MEFTKLFELPHLQLKHSPNNDCLAYKQKGKWVKFSTQEVVDNINAVSKGLLKLGVKKGDKIGLISTSNRPEWNFFDLGMQQIGAINVPIYPTISPKEYDYIFNNAEIKFCIVSDEGILAKVNKIKENVPSLEDIYSFDEIEGCKHWTEIKEVGQELDISEVEAIKETIDPEDLVTLIYTSGTTGVPKGVMLCHRNIVSNIKSAMACIPLEDDYKALSFLPLCHIFERTVVYGYFSQSVSIYYAESVEKLGDNLKEVKPDFFTTVPRLLEKVYDKIIAKGMDLTGAKRKLFFWAVDLGHEFKPDGRSWLYDRKLALADKLIFSKWREALGGNVKGILTGAAAMQPRLLRVFNAAGMIVREAYGLTETSPALTINRFEPEGCIIGTVGPPIPGVEIKIAEDNEILAKGPNIMLGYYKRDDANKEVFSGENNEWFHTGDVGEWVSNGKYKFLKITDRKKELFKTSGGKYVAPQALENKFKESMMIEQVMAIGNDKKFVSAFYCPSFAALEDFCECNDIPTSSKEDMCNHPKVVAEYQRITDEYNEEFSKIEKIKKFKILPVEWSVEGGELTPTMKMKRKKILEKYKSDVEDIYNV